MIICCTQKMLAFTKINIIDSALQEDYFYTWTVHWFKIGRRSVCCFFHNMAGLTIWETGIKKHEVNTPEKLHKKIVASITNYLRQAGCKEDFVAWYAESMSGGVLLRKNKDRSVASQISRRIVDFKWSTELPTEDGLLVNESRGINKWIYTINGELNYVSEVFEALAAKEYGGEVKKDL